MLQLFLISYLNQFMDKKLFVHLQGGRKVSGVLRGYDLFLNLVIDDAVEESTPAQKHPIGTVVSITCPINDGYKCSWQN
jgi:small nuclear ribonucleoprotein (snRNP)-like protein